MASYILKRKLFTTDIQAAENELRQAEALLARTPQNSPRYQTLKTNVDARRSSLQRMTQTSQMAPNQVYTTAPATPTPAPKPTTPPPPPPKPNPTTAAPKQNPMNGATKTSNFKLGKVGKGALIGTAVLGTAYLASRQINKNKEKKAQNLQNNSTNV